jgi:hypothetical protein
MTGLLIDSVTILITGSNNRKIISDNIVLDAPGGVVEQPPQTFWNISNVVFEPPSPFVQCTPQGNNCEHRSCGRHLGTYQVWPGLRYLNSSTPVVKSLYGAGEGKANASGNFPFLISQRLLHRSSDQEKKAIASQNAVAINPKPYYAYIWNSLVACCTWRLLILLQIH